MNKQTILASIMIINLIILGCSISGYDYSPAKEVPELLGEVTEAASIMEPGIVLEPDIVLTEEPEVSAVPVESAPANSETTSDPLQANYGTHSYSSQAVSFDCTCQETGTVTSNFVFSDDSVVDGSNIYLKTGEHIYTRSWTGQSILVVDGKDTTIDIQKHSVLIFSPHGYILENYSDADPSSGAPCCFYEFTLEK